MPSSDPTRTGGPPRGRLFSFGVVLVLAALPGAPEAVTAPGTADVAHALLSGALPVDRSVFVGPGYRIGERTEHVTRARPDDPELIDWRKLRGLDYRTGERSEDLEELEGKLVKMAGFPVPFEDWATNVTEFLLVPYEGACVHAPAPPPNQVVWVKMYGRTRARLLGQNPVWVEGTLHIEMGDNVYGQAAYRLVGMKVSPYSW